MCKLESRTSDQHSGWTRLCTFEVLPAPGTRLICLWFAALWSPPSSAMSCIKPSEQGIGGVGVSIFGLPPNINFDSMGTVAFGMLIALGLVHV